MWQQPTAQMAVAPVLWQEQPAAVTVSESCSMYVAEWLVWRSADGQAVVVGRGRGGGVKAVGLVLLLAYMLIFSLQAFDDDHRSILVVEQARHSSCSCLVTVHSNLAGHQWHGMPYACALWLNVYRFGTLPSLSTRNFESTSRVCSRAQSRIACASANAEAVDRLTLLFFETSCLISGARSPLSTLLARRFSPARLRCRDVDKDACADEADGCVDVDVTDLSAEQSPAHAGCQPSDFSTCLGASGSRWTA
jgi:hypothetical protein